MKTWRPLFSFLLDTTIGNCYLLLSYKPTPSVRVTRKDTHCQFQKDLFKALLKASTRPTAPRGNRVGKRKATDEIIWQLVREHKLVKLWPRIKQKNCSRCIEEGRTANQRLAARKPLADLSTNTTRTLRENSTGWKRPKRPSRTNYGCSVCRIPFCANGDCWSTHMAKLNSKD